MLQGQLCQAVALHLQVLHQGSRACSCTRGQVGSSQQDSEALCLMLEFRGYSLRLVVMWLRFQPSSILHTVLAGQHCSLSLKMYHT